MTRMSVSHRYAADVESVYALMSDPAFIKRKYAALGATDTSVEHEDRDGAAHNVIHRKVTIDLPGFARKVMQPTNTLVQVDDWAPADAAGTRVCRYTVEVQGVPSRITGTLTLSADGDGGTRQDVDADVKVSIPLLGGRLEKFAVDSGVKLLEEDAAFTAAALQ